MILIKLILIFPLILGQLHENNSEFKLAVIFLNCTTQENLYKNVQIESNIQWTIDRLNILNTFENHKIAYKTFHGCSDENFLDILFEISKLNRENFVIAALTENELTEKVRNFAEILEINLEELDTHEDNTHLIRSSIDLLEKLSWSTNLTLLVPNTELMEEFFSYSRFKLICIKKVVIYNHNASYDFNISTSDFTNFVLFGNSVQLTNFLNNNEALIESQLLVVPTDGFVINDLGDKMYIILPSMLPSINEKHPNPTVSRFFQTSQPILSHTEFLRTFIKLHCKNESINETPLDCLKSKMPHIIPNFSGYDKDTILKILKIEQLRNNFLYEIFKIEKNQRSTNLRKIFTYNMFDGSITDLYNTSNGNDTFCSHNLHQCSANGFCVNFARTFERNSTPSPPIFFVFEFRAEPWVLVYLAISSIGVLLSLLILIFVSVCVYRKDILEGNPVTTIFLLLTVLLMYTCVVLFAVSPTNEHDENTVCLLKIYGTTFSFCAVFSLILSRAILLSTVTKEIAYMSHIPGVVQAFLALFIMAVQLALNLPIFKQHQEKFCDFYYSISFLYLMSYNFILVILILCLAPFIFNSKRNYKEGRYFTISAILITLCWCFWISCFKALNDTWKDIIVCFALVATATIIQGVVFVSRTYLMTVSSVRNKYRAKNTLASLNGRNSALDIYRSQERRAYDRVNVATINAANTSNIDMVTDLDEMDEDIYNYPTLPRDEEINFDVQTNSSTYTDKVTRF